MVWISFFTEPVRMCGKLFIVSVRSRCMKTMSASGGWIRCLFATTSHIECVPMRSFVYRKTLFGKWFQPPTQWHLQLYSVSVYSTVAFDVKCHSHTHTCDTRKLNWVNLFVITQANPPQNWPTVRSRRPTNSIVPGQCTTRQLLRNFSSCFCLFGFCFVSVSI